jgi:hypothetical protein
LEKRWDVVYEVMCYVKYPRFISLRKTIPQAR